MGLTLSTEFSAEYSEYIEIIGSLNQDGVEKSYEKILRKGFSDIYDMEAVGRILYSYSATYENSIKYAQLAKKLENEMEGGINRFGDVFKKVLDNLVVSSICEAGKLQDQKRQNAAKLISHFLANLFTHNVIDEKFASNIVRRAKIKSHLEHYVKLYTNLTKEKLKTYGCTDYDEIHANSSENGNEKLSVVNGKARGKIIKVDSLDFVTDFDSFCYHVDYRSNMKKDILHDEQMFNAKLIASLNISSVEELRQICERFVDRAIMYESYYLPIFGQLALRINSALVIPELDKEASFKNILIETIIKRFDSIPVEEEVELEKRMVIALYGEMYNINWVKQATLNTFMNALKCLKNDYSYIIFLQSLLKSCGMKISVNGSKELMIDIRDEVKRVSKKEEKDDHLRYLVHDALQQLNFIVGIREQSEQKILIPESSEKHESNKRLSIDNLFKDMCEEAYLDVINDVKSKPIDNVEEFIEKLITKAISSCAMMVAKASRDICTTTYMREILSNKCHSTFLDYMKDENKCGSTIRLLHYIGELYNLDVFTNDFINLCFEILFEHVGEMATTGISVLLRNVGQKMEIANTQKLESYFLFFDHIISTEHSRRSREFKKLKALRANDWNEHGIQHSYEDFLMLYTIENAEVEEVIGKFHSSPVEMEKFIFALWKTVLKDPHPSYADLCKKLSKFNVDFNYFLVDFLKSRCNTFANLESQHYNEAVNCHLGKVEVFIAELYSMDVIPEYLFEIWVDPRLASKIPNCYILTILALITPKIQATNNTRLQTLLTNLEHINEDKSQQKWNSLCGDMKDLKAALMEYKSHQKH